MTQEEKAHLKEMPFWDHFGEVRKRMVSALVVFLVGFLLCFFITNEWILAFLRKPLFDALPVAEQKLYFTHLFENFLTHLKVAAYSSIFFFSPYFFYQLWSFVVPGLYSKERKLILPFSFLAALCFLLGAMFAYCVVFPIGFRFFVTYGAPSDTPLLTIDAYYGTCLKLMLLFGVAFDFPVLLILFGYLGLLPSKWLKQNRKTAILVITVLSALCAPPDAVSMLLLMAPLILLYEGSIWVISYFEKKQFLSSTPENEKKSENKEDQEKNKTSPSVKPPQNSVPS